MDTDDKSSDHEDKTENNFKLIKQISMRPALFNYQLPPVQRTKKIRDGFWLECAKELETTVYDCQRRWKNLRDTYHLYRQHHKNLLERWRYTKSLSFLQNIHTVKARKKKTEITNNNDVISLTNCEKQYDNNYVDADDYLRNKTCEDNIKFENHNIEDVTVENLFDESNSSEDEQQQQNQKKVSRFKRRRTKKSSVKNLLNNNDNDEMRSNKKDCDPIMIRTECNETAAVFDRQKDEIDLFLDFLNKKIRKLSLDDINEIQRKFLDIVLEKESKLLKR